jgi:pimeloyl-ACP methyl ester carboxylesterase
LLATTQDERSPSRLTYRWRGLYIRAWVPAEEQLPPAVLLHGVVIAGQYMTPLAEKLARAMRVYVPDLPGLGRSNRLPAPRDIAATVEALREWMLWEGLSQVVLVGNSFGCQLATLLALSAPPAVRALALVGPTMDAARRPLLQLAASSARVVLTESVALHLLWLRGFVRAGPSRSARYCLMSWQDHIEERLPHISVPSLVVRGISDQFVSQGWAESVAETLSRGGLLLVKGAGHAAHYNKPVEVAAEILTLTRLVADQSVGSRPGDAGN